MTLFYQKSSFYPQDFQILVFLSSPLFFILGYCWFYRKNWLMISSKVYGIIMLRNWIKKKHRFFNICSFYPQDFQILVFLSSPLFFILGYCWFYRKNWLMISSKVYGIIMLRNWIKKKHRFFNIWWSKVLIFILGHGKIWLSQGQL